MPHSLDLTDLTVVYASLLDLIDLIVVNFILVRLLGRPPKCPRVNQGNNVGSPTALCFGIPGISGNTVDLSCYRVNNLHFPEVEIAFKFVNRALITDSLRIIVRAGPWLPHLRLFVTAACFGTFPGQWEHSHLRSEERTIVSFPEVKTAFESDRRA